MLTYLLSRMTVRQWHWAAGLLGVYDGLHEVLHGFCPCQAADLDLDDEDDDCEDGVA